MGKPAYDDAEVLADYVGHYSRRFMSDLEKRSLEVCMAAYRIEGALQSEDEWFRQYAMDAAKKFWESEITDDVRPALAIGFKVYKERLVRRFLVLAKACRLPVNRCPKCGCVARTPTAKQCRWCSFTWRA